MSTAQGRYGPATDCFEQVLAVARQIDDRNGQFEAHRGLGRVHHATSQHHDALHDQRTALQLASTSTNPPIRPARTTDSPTPTTLGNPDRARHHWRAALALLTSLGTDRTEEPGVTSAAIRARLHDLDNRSTTR